MMHRPFAAPAMSSSAMAPVVRQQEYPSIDEFLDDLPPIENFLASEPEVVDEVEEMPEEDWLLAGWKSYDFSSLSALTMRTPSKPVHAVTQASQNPVAMGNPAYSPSAPGPSAEEVAAALDGIARRIRSGELMIDNLHETPPEAAMAAAIAALLRMRG